MALPATANAPRSMADLDAEIEAEVTLEQGYVVPPGRGGLREARRSTAASSHLLYSRLMFRAHEQIPSSLIRKTVIRLGADRRHRGFIETLRV
jgi:hypothetical protein